MSKKEEKNMNAGAEAGGKKKKKGGKGLLALFILALVVFLGAGGYLIFHVAQGKIAEHDFASLRVEGGHDLAALYKENPDIVGWVSVKDTKIDYPVMQTPSDPEYYLRRNFKKEESMAGTPFMDASSDMTSSSNWMIYGHNMKNGTMFHDLLEYDDPEFWKGHKTFTFDTIDKYGGPGTYEVVCALYTRIYPKNSNEFKYYEYAYIGNEVAFDEYVNGCRALALYDTGVVPQYGDQLVTLSTCAYHVEDGRFIVVGRKVD